MYEYADAAVMTLCQLTDKYNSQFWGLGGVVVEFSLPISEATGSNLGPAASCWKVGSYLPMPGDLQCSMHWFPPHVNYP